MTVRLKEGMIPYTGGTGIEITDNHVINVLLREMNNLIHVNEDKELYVDLQLPSGVTPAYDFPVGITTGRILQADGRQQSATIINSKTTSGDYVRLIYANDGNLYYDPGTGNWIMIGNATAMDVNTKTFFVTATQTPVRSENISFVINDTTPLQDAIDWIAEGNEALIDVNFVLDGESSSQPRTVLTFSGRTDEDDVRTYTFSNAVGTNGATTAMALIINCTESGGEYTVNSASCFVSNTHYLATDNTTSYIPTGDYNPATKKYVDDTVGGAISRGTTAPSSPTEGQLWYDTDNDVLKVYDGTTWVAVGSSADINTKTFFITGTIGDANINTVKSAIAYYEEGKNPILFYRDESDSTKYGAYLLKQVAHNIEVQGDVSYLFTRIGQRHGSNGWVGDDNLDVYKAGDYVEVVRMVEGKIYTIAGEPESAVNQDIYGVKTFHSAPLVPSKSTSAGNNPTSIATEAQVYLKQDKLTAGSGIVIDSNTNTISANIQGALVYKGNVATTSNLPASGTVGDVYYVEADGLMYAWDGTAWKAVGNTQIDLSNYFNMTTNDSDDITAGTTNLFVTQNQINQWNTNTNDITTINGTITNIQLDITNLQNTTSGLVSDTAYSSAWDGDTTHAPSKNAIYDVLGDVETLLANL